MKMSTKGDHFLHLACQGGLASLSVTPLGLPLSPVTVLLYYLPRSLPSIVTSDATGLNRLNIKFFRLQHQMSGINIKKT